VSLIRVIIAIVCLHLVFGQRPDITWHPDCVKACGDIKDTAYKANIDTKEKCIAHLADIAEICRPCCMQTIATFATSGCKALLSAAGLLPAYNKGSTNYQYTVTVALPDEQTALEIYAYKVGEVGNRWTSTPDVVGAGSKVWTPTDTRIKDRAWFVEQNTLTGVLGNRLYNDMWTDMDKMFAGGVGLMALARPNPKNLYRVTLLPAIRKLFFDLGICTDEDPIDPITVENLPQTSLADITTRGKTEWNGGISFFGGIHNDQRKQTIKFLAKANKIMVNLWSLSKVPKFTDCNLHGQHQDKCDAGTESRTALPFAVFEDNAHFDLLTKGLLCVGPKDNVGDICYGVNQVFSLDEMAQVRSNINQMTYYLLNMKPHQLMVWVYANHGKGEVLNDDAFYTGRQSVDVRYICTPTQRTKDAVIAQGLVDKFGV